MSINWKIQEITQKPSKTSLMDLYKTFEKKTNPLPPSPEDFDPPRHLMQLSDLDNLLSVVTICYQLGESYLNVFLLRKMDNLLSVFKFYQYWIIFLSDLMNLPHNREYGHNLVVDHNPSFFPQFCLSSLFRF